MPIARSGDRRACRALPEDAAKQTKKDFTSAQEVRWCPGCGDYADPRGRPGLPARARAPPGEHRLRLRHRLLVAVPVLPRHLRPALDPRPRAGDRDRARDDAGPTSTSGSITGDGDALSIGGNHLIHALRRNVNLTILLFNNRIYGLTKGQYSPTSETGKITKSTPSGSVDEPFNPVSLALGAEATFVARTLDSDRKHLTVGAARRPSSTAAARWSRSTRTARSSTTARSTCSKDRDEAQARLVPLEHGAADRVRRARRGRRPCVRAGRRGASPVRRRAPPGPCPPVVHDAHAADPSPAFALSRLDDRSMAHVPIGVFRSVSRPTYDDLVREQVGAAVGAAPAADARTTTSAALLAGSDTWTVG